jgi:hypothetical protein
MEAQPRDEVNKLEPHDETGRARIAAVQALKDRIKVEEEAERSRIRADGALQAQRAADEAAEKARLEAEEAARARRAADQEAERARLAAEEALKAWRDKLARAIEAEALNPERAEPIGELRAVLDDQVAAHVAATAEPDSPAAATPQSTCVVSYRREYRKVTFYACAFDDEGNELVLAESAQFRARGDGAPERTEQAVAAFEGLTAQLARDGWEPAGLGDMWFAQVFRRHVAAASD